MAKKKQIKTDTKGLNIIGRWTFALGIVIALISGLFNAVTGEVLIFLVLLGIVVGFINITPKETGLFLFSALVLVFLAVMGKDTLSAIPVIFRILDAFVALLVPAATIVALKTMYVLAAQR